MTTGTGFVYEVIGGTKACLCGHKCKEGFLWGHRKKNWSDKE